jgi:hypothetical protein
MTYKRQLLCTFSRLDNINKTIELIRNIYKDFNDKIFIFSNSNESSDVYLTYNITNNIEKIPNTILIHRKKDYNTLYTINSLNQLIRDENGGILDKSFIVRWDLYQNCLIINGEISVKIIPLSLLRIEHSHKYFKKS